MVFFPRYFTVCITYQPPLIINGSHKFKTLDTVDDVMLAYSCIKFTDEVIYPVYGYMQRKCNTEVFNPKDQNPVPYVLHCLVVKT